MKKDNMQLSKEDRKILAWAKEHRQFYINLRIFFAVVFALVTFWFILYIGFIDCGTDVNAYAIGIISTLLAVSVGIVVFVLLAPKEWLLA